LKITLLYFAVLRDIAGKRDDVVELPDGTRAADVWRRLRDQHAALRDYVQPPMTAINESYADPEQVLRDGDELAFIPPVAGG
jgi:molybdopterin converting factor subunit 1